MTSMTDNPCFSCIHRAKSKVIAEKLPASLDVTPKNECKAHTGYGLDEDKTRSACRDYEPFDLCSQLEKAALVPELIEVLETLILISEGWLPPESEKETAIGKARFLVAKVKG